MLDVAVRESKSQDRRGRDSRSLHPRGRRQVLRFFDRLHVRGGYGASGDPRHAPKLALASHLLADRRKDPTGEVVLEVTVRVADQKGLCGNAAPPLVSTGRVPSCRSLKTIKCMDEHLMDVFRGQSLYDPGYVARSVGISRRREVVSFTHHRRVAFPSSPSIALQRPRQRESSSCRSGSSLNASTHTERRTGNGFESSSIPRPGLGSSPVEAHLGIRMTPSQPWRTAHETLVYQADVDSVRVLDDHAVVLKGYVQYRDKDERIIKTDKVWLYVVVDDKLFRSQVFETEAAALEAYRRLGIDLGVSSLP